MPKVTKRSITLMTDLEHGQFVQRTGVILEANLKDAKLAKVKVKTEKFKPKKETTHWNPETYTWIERVDGIYQH